MAVVYATYSFRTGEAINESVVRESTELAVNERVEDGESMVNYAFLMPIMRSACSGCYTDSSRSTLNLSLSLSFPHHHVSI